MKMTARAIDHQKGKLASKQALSGIISTVANAWWTC